MCCTPMLTCHLPSMVPALYFPPAFSVPPALQGRPVLLSPCWPHCAPSRPVLVQTEFGTVCSNHGLPRPGTKPSGPGGRNSQTGDRDRWSGFGPDRVPIGLGPNFPNTTLSTCTQKVRDIPWPTCCEGGVDICPGRYSQPIALRRHVIFLGQTAMKWADISHSQHMHSEGA